MGELGTYPWLIRSLSLTLSYKWSLLNNKDKNSLIYKAVKEMSQMVNSGIDCWLSRVEQSEKLLCLSSPKVFSSKDSVRQYYNKHIKSAFDLFYIDQINSVKLGEDGCNHNKLRFYSTFKGSHTREPYLDLVNNKTQRSYLSRLRMSASVDLEIEQGRYKGKPLLERICNYCFTGDIGDEKHFLLKCPTFLTNRQCFIGKLSSLIPSFKNMSTDLQLRTMLCPTTAIATKLVNKYIQILFNNGARIDNGDAILSYLTNSTNVNCDNYIHTNCDISTNINCDN